MQKHLYIEHVKNLAAWQTPFHTQPEGSHIRLTTVSPAYWPKDSLVAHSKFKFFDQHATKTKNQLMRPWDANDPPYNHKIQTMTIFGSQHESERCCQSAILDSLANTAIKYFIVSCQVRVAKTTSSRKSSPLSSDLEPKFCLASQLWILGTKSITTNFKPNASRKPWTHVNVFLSLFFFGGSNSLPYIRVSGNHSYGIIIVTTQPLVEKIAGLQSSHPSESFNGVLNFSSGQNETRCALYPMQGDVKSHSQQ